jgi:hypothetical protein
MRIYFAGHAELIGRQREKEKEVSKEFKIPRLVSYFHIRPGGIYHSTFKWLGMIVRERRKQ